MAKLRRKQPLPSPWSNHHVRPLAVVRPSPASSQNRSFAWRLLDDLVGAGEDRWRDGQAERSGGLEIDDQLESGRLLDRQIGRLLALEDDPILTLYAVGQSLVVPTKQMTPRPSSIVPRSMPAIARITSRCYGCQALEVCH
jgi:hypothetical protein